MRALWFYFSRYSRAVAEVFFNLASHSWAYVCLFFFTYCENSMDLHSIGTSLVTVVIKGSF